MRIAIHFFKLASILFFLFSFTSCKSKKEKKKNQATPEQTQEQFEADTQARVKKFLERLGTHPDEKLRVFLQGKIIGGPVMFLIMPMEEIGVRAAFVSHIDDQQNKEGAMKITWELIDERTTSDEMFWRIVSHEGTHVRQWFELGWCMDKLSTPSGPFLITVEIVELLMEIENHAEVQSCLHAEQYGYVDKLEPLFAQPCRTLREQGIHTMRQDMVPMLIRRHPDLAPYEQMMMEIAARDPSDVLQLCRQID